MHTKIKFHPYKKGYKRLSVNISRELHEKLKLSSAKRGVTVSRIVNRAIYKFLTENDKVEF